jgi:hypothetical protein
MLTSNQNLKSTGVALQQARNNQQLKEVPTLNASLSSGVDSSYFSNDGTTSWRGGLLIGVTLGFVSGIAAVRFAGWAPAGSAGLIGPKSSNGRPHKGSFVAHSANTYPESSSRSRSHSGLPELDNVAVVIVGGINRTEFAQACDETWLSQISQRLYVTDGDQPVSELGGALATYTVNVFADYPTTQMQLEHFLLKKHPFRKRGSRPQKIGNTHGIGWQLGQPRYLLGLEKLVSLYPDAEWYIVADSDTFMYPRRLSHGVLANYSGYNQEIAFGAEMIDQNGGKPALHMLLGGSGIVISAAAIRRMNISECAIKQNTDIEWNKLPADWRVSKCLTSHNIKLQNVDYMWMVTKDWTCGAHGPQGCASFYTRVHRDQHTDCPLTLHYMGPDAMREAFAKSEERHGDVCVPVPESQGLCNCSKI